MKYVKAYSEYTGITWLFWLNKKRNTLCYKPKKDKAYKKVSTNILAHLYGEDFDIKKAVNIGLKNIINERKTI